MYIIHTLPGPGAVGRVAGPEPHGSATAGAGLDPQGSLFFMGETDGTAAGRPQGSTGVAGLVAPPTHTNTHTYIHMVHPGTKLYKGPKNCIDNCNSYPGAALGCVTKMQTSLAAK